MTNTLSFGDNDSTSNSGERKRIDELNDQIWKDTWKGNWTELFVAALDAINRAQGICYPKGLANAYLNIGQLHRLHSRPDESEPALIQAKRLFAEVEDQMGLGAVCHQLGLLYMHQGSYERSIEHLLEARSIWMKKEDKPRLATNHVAIANLYSALEQYDSAEEEYSIAKEIYLQAQDERGYARVLSNCARVAQAKGDFQKAMSLQVDAIEILQRFDLQVNIASTYLNMGSTFCKLALFEKAIEVLLEGLDVADQNQYRRAQFIGRMYLAETYLATNNPGAARRYFDDAEQFKAFSNLSDLMALHSDIEASICAAEGNFKRAYELQKESAITRNKLMSAQTQQAVSAKILHYKFEQEILQERQRNAHDNEVRSLRHDYLERELHSTASALLTQIELLSSFRDEIRAVLRKLPATEPIIKELKEKLKALPAESIDWERFDAQFKVAHPGFVKELTVAHPTLTPMEVRMCALLRSNLRSPDIGRLLCLSERTIGNHRFNIRKKLGLTRSIDLKMYLQRF